MQSLDRPTIFLELSGQMIQELRVTRAVADTAEVGRRINDSGPEVPAPHAVHQNARRQWVLGHVLSKLETTAALGERRRFPFAQNAQKVTRDFPSQVVGLLRR